jgi:phytoene/squalene synthetase
MDRFGVTENDLAASSATDRVRDLVAFETGRARELLDRGAPIVGTLRGAARAAVAGYVAGGRAALAAIAASGHDVLAATPRPANRRVAAELIKAYVSGR